MSRSGLQLGHVLSNMVSISTRSGRISFTMASIGPCPFKHGKGIPYHTLHFRSLASIGPCPFKHGKSISRSASMCPATELQLGHVLSNMVRRLNITVVEYLKMLQLGHVLSNMVSASDVRMHIDLLKLQLGHVLSNMVRG